MICLFKRNTNFVRISGSVLSNTIVNWKCLQTTEWVFDKDRLETRFEFSRSRESWNSRVTWYFREPEPTRSDPNRTEPSIGYPRFSDSRTPLVSSEAIELENLESRRFSPVRYDINRSTGNWVRPAEWRRRFLRSMYCERSV